MSDILKTVNAMAANLTDVETSVGKLPVPKHKRVKLTDLREDSDNFRNQENVRANGQALAPDIMANGLREPLVGEDNGDHVRILKGSSRLFALRSLAELPDSLQSGIPVIVYTGLTESQRELIRADHSSSRPLTRREIVETAWRLQAQGKRQETIAYLLRGPMSDWSGAKVRATLEATLRALQSAGQATDKTLASACWQAFRNTLGRQCLDCGMYPESFREARLAHADAIDGKITTEQFAELSAQAIGFVFDTTAQNTLSSAYKADVKANQWTAYTGGPKFDDAVTKLRAEHADKANGAPTIRWQTSATDWIALVNTRVPAEYVELRTLLLAPVQTGEFPIEPLLQRLAR